MFPLFILQHTWILKVDFFFHCYALVSRDSNSAAELKYGIKICFELGNFYRNSRPVSALGMQDIICDLIT